ncbi:CRISPR-associated endonuclease Cas2 [Nakamurella multipartita]|uniref:CRISPR-associated endoribonuclease Cas2 n=1 Tax=Nakamurella multipartita (strain ATCC 700099 / DSM 44233 / CIP 104796 / JCM 9543 / NBRC 105858 / Y-104) TaxID=479431 RepID=C8XDI4_NAKMY|nr:CRISPR-associated endonuclease Cas2 [Nakamurella multipartita]ACV77648.1 CRISPR-associated protein Cas2 [Nakamurella multipartita DSM 44233]
MALTVIVAYDISEDNRRARLAAVLQAYGDRIQKSVFVLSADQPLIDDLHRRARDIIDLDRDSVYFFRQCAPCWESVGVVGQATVAEPQRYWAVF